MLPLHYSDGTTNLLYADFSTELNLHLFFVLQFYVILSPVLLYVVLIYIYKLYVYCSVPSYNHQKQKPSMSLCSMKFEPEKQNRKNHDTESQIRIENPEKTKNQSTQSTKQSAGFLHNITL